MMTCGAAHITDWDPQHPAWPQPLISPDLVTELDVLDGDVVLKTQPGQCLALRHHVVQELGPVAAGARARAVTLPRVSICEQEPFTRSSEAEMTINTDPGVTRCLSPDQVTIGGAPGQQLSVEAGLFLRGPHMAVLVLPPEGLPGHPPSSPHGVFKMRICCFPMVTIKFV